MRIRINAALRNPHHLRQWPTSATLVSAELSDDVESGSPVRLSRLQPPLQRRKGCQLPGSGKSTGITSGSANPIEVPVGKGDAECVGRKV